MVSTSRPVSATPWPREHDDIGLEVVSDLEDPRVLEDRLEPVERGLSIECAAAAEALVAERHVTCRRAPQWRTQGRSAWHARRRAVGDNPQSEPACRAKLADEIVERLGRRDRRVILLMDEAVGANSVTSVLNPSCEKSW